MGIYLKHKGRSKNQWFNNMPRFDGTGPWGCGPRTGRAFGPCGYGRGVERRFFTKKEETEILQEEVEDLKNELEAAKERLTGLKGQK